ncbi:MAG: WD40 repeat domain-containing protein, partial [Planctomycetota bacterium]
VAGSHNRIVDHIDTHDDQNLLTRGQEIAVEVDENEGTVDLLILHEGESRPERLRRYRDGPPLHPLAFSPDGRWLMTSGAGGGVRAWCLSRDAVAMSHAEPRHLLGGRDAGRTLRPHAFHRHDVVWLGAHQMVTSSEGVERAELRLWDAAEPRSAGEPLLSTRAEGYGWAPSADGTWTYPISQLERPFFHLDVGRRRLRATVIDAALHEFMANVVGDVLFVGGMLSSLGYCRLGQDGTIANLRLPPAHWGFLVKQSSASGRWSLVQPKGEERLVLWNVAPDDRVVQVELPGLEAGVPLSARYAFDANAERLACALDDGRLFVWSLAHDAPSLSRWGDPTDHTITLTRSAQYLYWLGDHDVLTVVDADGATWLWDLAAARPSGQRMRPDPPDPDTWSVSADGRWLFALDGGTGRVWPLQSTRGATGFTVGSFRPGERSWFQLSGDGAWLLGASDGEWRVTRVDPRRPKATHHRLAPNLEGVGVSPIDPSGRWIVTWGDAEGARLWSLDTERATVVASELFVSSAPRQVVFSEDGRYLVAQVGERACLWDLELDDPSGPPVLLPATDIDRLVHCADGRVATLGGACLRVWSLRLEELVAYAGRRVERELTPSERAAYLPDP